MARLIDRNKRSKIKTFLTSAFVRGKKKKLDLLQSHSLEKIIFKKKIIRLYLIIIILSVLYCLEVFNVI